MFDLRVNRPDYPFKEQKAREKYSWVFCLESRIEVCKNMWKHMFLMEYMNNETQTKYTEFYTVLLTHLTRPIWEKAERY